VSALREVAAGNVGYDDNHSDPAGLLAEIERDLNK
jgi:hypothetical protein